MDDGGDEELTRMSIKVSGPPAVLGKLASQCQMEGGFKRGLTGVVYGLDSRRIEIVAEGKRIDKFVEWVESYLNDNCAGMDDACELATVASKNLKEKGAMHKATFPVINFDAMGDKEVVIVLESDDKLVLDYTLRHTKIEAKFNRQLDYTSRWIDDSHLELTVDGPVRQLKSFVRWARRGPPLQKPKSVAIRWIDDPSLEEAENMSTQFRDEGIVG